MKTVRCQPPVGQPLNQFLQVTIIFRLVVQFLWLLNSYVQGPFRPNQQYSPLSLPVSLVITYTISI